MAESSQFGNDQGFSATDYADLQHIGSQLPQGHPVRAKIDKVLSAVQPNAGLAGPAAPGPIQNVAHTEGPIARALTAGENRIADIHQQGQQQEHDFQNRFLNNQPIAAPMLHQNATLQNPINGIVNPEARERFGKGDIAGGIGEVGANVLPLEIARQTGGGEPIANKATVENFTAPIRGIAKTGNAVLRNPVVKASAPIVGGLIGYGAGEAVGHPYMGSSAGYGVGRVIKSGNLTLPGERLGLPPEPPSYDPTILPEQSGPMRADVSRLGPPTGVGKYSPPERVPPPVRTAPIQRAPAPVETPAPQVSMADQIATAKGLGFKNLGDAIAKFGYEGWQKVIASPTEPPTASIGPIGKPTPFERPYTPEHIPTNRARLADVLDDQAIKQQMEGEQGPRSMVTGRKGGSVSLFPHESTSLNGEGRMAELERGREVAAGNATDQTKGSLLNQFRGVAAPTAVADVQANRPLPGSDVAANRTVGGSIRPGDEKFDYITGKKKK